MCPSFLRPQITDLSLSLSSRTAHRLRTICQYDRILVLADHHIAEFDSPFNLLQKDGGVFKSLVDASSDADELREMAAARQT